MHRRLKWLFSSNPFFLLRVHEVQELDLFYDVSWVINILLLVSVKAVRFNAVRLCGALILA